MTLDIPTFRSQFPEFSNTEKYPTAQVAFWASVAAAQVNQRVWCNQWTLGVSLYTAHELVLAYQNQQTSTFGGAPGTFGGIANAKGVGSSNVSYDSQSTSEKDAGYWNLTNYGKQFMRFVKLLIVICLLH